MRSPKQNAKFWFKKIGDNQKRDRQITRRLRADDWNVCRIWECRLKKPKATILRMLE
ncbi:MAG: Very short patch repair protein [Verrucomicrobia subdivision 3 bacterium]|nr:Very short patch repair protein [Limisphaerales bacterium]MCS1416519.1 Very short patch repair protein [Limisphaerales bacterium]